MARTANIQVNRIVTYIRSGFKPVAAKVTAVTSQTVLDLKILGSNEVKAGVTKGNYPSGNVWKVR